MFIFHALDFIQNQAKQPYPYGEKKSLKAPYDPFIIQKKQSKAASKAKDAKINFMEYF